MFLFELQFCLDLRPKVGVLNYMTAIFLVFKETSYYCSQWLHQFIFPPTVQGGSLFSASFPEFLICRLFNNGYSDRASQAALVVKNLPANAGNAGDVSLIPEWGRSPGRENDNPLQDSCLENSLDRGNWWVTVHRVSKSRS